MSPGERAFDAYNAAGLFPWMSWDKRPVPKWSEVGDDIRTKWEAAARAISEQLLSDVIRSAAKEYPR